MRPRVPFRRLPAAVMLLTALAARAATPPFPSLSTVTLVSTEGAYQIPDNGSVVSLLTVENQPGVVVDVDVTVDITHTQADNLDLFLVSPSGRTVTLSTDCGQQNDDVFAGTTFDDQAAGTPSAPNVRNVTFTDKVVATPLQPEEAMGAFIGEAAEGPWALVVIDDTSGQTGMLRGWSLSVSTIPVASPGAPLVLAGTGGTIPSNVPSGLTSSVLVSGAGTRVWDVDVTVDIAHPRADEIDLFLTAPSGRRIDLVTDVGGGNVDLYRGTTFDDQAGTAVSDTPLPPSGTAFTAVVPEGALGAFVGEDPNGTWTLTVVDDAAGNTGTLNGWSLRLTTTTACGDGAVNPGELCDDGNPTDGDGCDRNCTPTGCGNGILTAGEDCDDGNVIDGDGCPSTCRTTEASCDDCVDNNADGVMDGRDPACGATSLVLSAGNIRGGRLSLDGDLGTTPAGGAVTIQLAGSQGTALCASLGALRRQGRRSIAKGRIVSGTISVMLRGTRVAVRGRGLSLGGLADGDITLAVGIGGQHFLGSGPFRTIRPGRRVYQHP